MSYINQFKFTEAAMEAYEKGYNDGTIPDSLSDVKDIVLDQEIVSYASARGTYTFDIYDFDNLGDF
jgi:hypothetical protein